jgi:hypothetical protein
MRLPGETGLIGKDAPPLCVFVLLKRRFLVNLHLIIKWHGETLDAFSIFLFAILLRIQAVRKAEISVYPAVRWSLILPSIKLEEPINS